MRSFIAATVVHPVTTTMVTVAVEEASDYHLWGRICPG